MNFWGNQNIAIYHNAGENPVRAKVKTISNTGNVPSYTGISISSDQNCSVCSIHENTSIKNRSQKKHILKSFSMNVIFEMQHSLDCGILFLEQVEKKYLRLLLQKSVTVFCELLF